MLDQHAPRHVDKDPSLDQEQSEDEKKLCKQIDLLFEKAAKHRRKYDKNWVDYYKYYRGEQWNKKRPSYRHSEVINLVFQAIQSMVPIMTDARPKIGFVPQEPQDTQFAEILNQLFESDYDKYNWLYKITEVIFDSHFYGVGFSSLEYDSDAEFGYGCIKFMPEDPFDMYPDPDARNVNEECEYFIKAKPEDVDKVKKRYANHKFADKIKADLDDLSFAKRNVELLHIRKNTDIDMPRDSLVYSAGVDDDMKDKVLVITAYLKPSDTEEVEQPAGENPEEKLFITKLKYPKGRKVVKINGYIFEDSPLDYDDMKFPYSRCTNYILPREFYGQSEIEQLKSPQNIFNKLISFTLDCMTLTGNPVWLVPNGSGVNPRKLINRPGLVVEYNGEEPPRRAEGTQLQPYILQMIDRMEKWFNDVSGTQDVSRGIQPGAVTAASAIDSLRDAAQTRIRQKMRNMDSYLQSVGTQYVSRVLQYYTQARVFRVTNNDDVTKYFKFHVEDRPDTDDLGQPKLKADGSPQTSKYGIMREYKKDKYGESVMSEDVKEFQIRGEFDVRVNTISGLPFAKAELEQRLLQFFDRGIIDSEEVLKKLDYPNYEMVMERVKKKQEAEAQAKAQQPQ